MIEKNIYIHTTLWLASGLSLANEVEGLNNMDQSSSTF